MTKAILRDKDKCINCYACIVSCNLKHNFPPHPVNPPEAEPKGIDLIHIYHYETCKKEGGITQLFMPLACMHCAEAPCIKACPRSAIYKDSELGVILTDRDKCIGCKFCLCVCPFGVPRYDTDGKLALCDMCIDRLREGKKTACEAVCVARAIFTGTPEEIAKLQQNKVVAKITRDTADS